MRELAEYDRAEILLLIAMDEDGGLTPSELVKQIPPSSLTEDGREFLRRLAHIMIKDMASEGLAAKLDDLKPTCWVRTKLGTELLANYTCDGRRR